jgi:hypothetical protein
MARIKQPKTGWQIFKQQVRIGWTAFTFLLAPPGSQQEGDWALGKEQKKKGTSEKRIRL